MRSIYWRFFLLIMFFLLALTILTAVVTSTVIHQLNIPFTQDARLKHTIDTAQKILTDEGFDRFMQWHNTLEKETALRIVLLDQSGRKINAKESHSLFHHLNFIAPLIEPKIIYSSEIYRSNGDKIHVVVRSPHSFPRLLQKIWPVVISRILTTFLLITLICYILLNMTVKPIKQLQYAVTQFSRGNLQCRLDGRILKRRDEFGTLANEYNKMAERIEVLIDEQQKLLQYISHELRSPLARLSVALGLIRRKVGMQVEAEINRIETETTELDHLIGEIITLTRIETHHTEYAHETLNLTSLLKKICHDCQYQNPNLPPILLKNIPNAYILGDANLVRRAIENIIHNAIKYSTKDKSISIDLFTNHIQKTHTIMVHDHGPGVSPDSLPLLTKPFYRASAHQQSGFGLGLAIVQQAMTRLQGKLIIQNGDEDGLEVQLVFPST